MSIHNKIYNIYPELKKIFENIEDLQNRYILVKGNVQSGKTKFIICASMLSIFYDYSVVIIIRNQQADREQLYERILNFQKEIGENFNVHKISKKIKKEGNKILLGLGNSSSIQKIIDSVESKKYILFVDEVDFIDSGDYTKKNKNLNNLKENSFCTFAISATIMDPMAKEEITPKDLFLLNVSQKYKGIDKISFKIVKRTCKFSGRMKDDLFKKDGCLLEFLEEFSQKSPFLIENNKKHPNICLINICRTKDPYYKVQNYISKFIPDLTTVVYNSDGISFCKGQESSEFRMQISECLQYLKDNGGSEKYPNIVIFSGDLASRGISFVSADYEWHLTCMRLLVARSCDEPELIQKVRLCGNYNDNIPLELYTTKKIKNDLILAFTRQEELLSGIKNSEDDKICRNFLESEPIYSGKFSSRSVVKDCSSSIKFNKVEEKVGWEYDKKDTEFPDEIYDIYGKKCENTSENKENNENEDIKLLELKYLPDGTLMRCMVEETLKWFVKSKEHNKLVQRTVVNQKLIDIDSQKFKSFHQLNGSWDSNIKNKMKNATIDTKGLLYVKKNSRYYFIYNV